MANNEVPRLGSAIYTEQINIKVDKSMKEDLFRLKSEEKIDVAEWIRQMIRRELRGIKSNFKAS